MTEFTLAHVGDVHLGPIAGFTPRYWNIKRAVGYLNWVRKRRSLYQREVLDRIVADVRAHAPDHIAVTGDLINLGLPREFATALDWLRVLGNPAQVSVVPGNHDIYSRIGSDAGTRRWAAYMQSNARGAHYLEAGSEFPFVRVLGDVALIGLNSAILTPPILSWGRVGWPQLGSLEYALNRLRADNIFRVVLIHHPPLPDQASNTRGLRDATAMQGVLEACGAELVLHGHNHHNMSAWLPCVSGTTAIVGAPAASVARHHKNEPLARYNLYTISGKNPWTLLVVGRGLAEPEGQVVELDRRAFTLCAT